MKTKFKDYLNEYHGPGKKMGFKIGGKDQEELFHITFAIKNSSEEIEEEENIKRILEHYDIDYKNFKSNVIRMANVPSLMFSFDFYAFNEQESQSIVKNILSPLNVIPESIQVKPKLPW